MGLFDPETPVLLAIGLVLAALGTMLSGVFLVLRDAGGSFGNRLVALLGTSAGASILYTALVGLDNVDAYRVVDGLELTIALAIALIALGRVFPRRGLTLIVAALAAISIADITGWAYVMTGSLPGIGVRPAFGEFLPLPSYCASPTTAFANTVALLVLIAAPHVTLRGRRRGAMLGAALATTIFAASWTSRADGHDCVCFDSWASQRVRVDCGLY